MPHVVMSEFRVSNASGDAVADAFRNRPAEVDQADGFLRLEVFRGSDDPDLFRLLTVWKTKEQWQRWYRSHAYRSSHRGIPRGTKIDKTSIQVAAFDALIDSSVQAASV